jgi:hypothetical protein
MAEKLWVALRKAGEDGLSGTQIRDLLGRHARIEVTNRALTQLQTAGLVTKIRVETGGRPEIRWIAT